MSAQTNIMPSFGKNKGEDDMQTGILPASMNQFEDIGCDEDEVASEHSTGAAAVNDNFNQINPNIGLMT